MSKFEVVSVNHNDEDPFKYACEVPEWEDTDDEGFCPEEMYSFEEIVSKLNEALLANERLRSEVREAK